MDTNDSENLPKSEGIETPEVTNPEDMIYGIQTSNGYKVLTETMGKHSGGGITSEGFD